MSKYKACINILSSRERCIKPCVKSLWDHWNHKYDYPVYVYYFDDIYDSEDFRQEVRNETSQNVHFLSIPYETPKHVPDSELFYNRNDLWYSRTQFPITRKGYLHMSLVLTKKFHMIFLRLWKVATKRLAQSR